jgi:hypothetical protein
MFPLVAQCTQHVRRPERRRSRAPAFAGGRRPLQKRAAAVAFMQRSDLSQRGLPRTYRRACSDAGGPDEHSARTALPTHLARDALFLRGTDLSAPVARRPSHRLVRCHERLSQGASQIRVRRLARPRADTTGRVRAESRSTRFADAPRTATTAARPRRRGRLAPLPFNMVSPPYAFQRRNRTDTCDAGRRRTRQSACLRKNAGMSYVSTPFSCSACTCEAAVSRELRHTAGVSNAP